MVYSHMFGPNQKEESAIVLRTEAEFRNFAGGGTNARLWLISRDPATNQRTKVDVKTLRAAAEAVADLRKDKNAYLWHRHPQDAVQGAWDETNDDSSVFEFPLSGGGRVGPTGGGFSSPVKY